MTSDDRLETISLGNWAKLRDCYLIDWPRHCVPFYTIGNYIRWSSQGADIDDVRILSLNGDFSDGTFILIVR